MPRPVAETPKLRPSIEDLEQRYARVIERFTQVFGFTPVATEFTIPLMVRCLEDPTSPSSKAFVEMLRRRALQGGHEQLRNPFV